MFPELTLLFCLFNFLLSPLLHLEDVSISGVEKQLRKEERAMSRIVNRTMVTVISHLCNFLSHKEI